ncbi:MAG: 4Fe-4S dicluster domain-containing protein [Methanimicrococcus sp.]|nr:4Fe-4S dicluster domain-containing protein [Methanimicrococcus sp.]
MKRLSSFYRLLLEKKQRSEIPIFGFADTDSWETDKQYPVPPDFYPKSVYPNAKTAIVIGVPVILPVIETTPSVFYNEHYHVLNAHLDSEALKLSYYLNDHESLAFPIPRDGYSGLAALKKDPTGAFSHKHAAYHAGLGTFGRNNTLLTPKYGPRIRFTTVLTSATFEELGVPGETAEQIEEMKKKRLCTECMACARFCPTGAVSNDKEKPYPVSRIDKVKCTDYSGILGGQGISPCGVCIKVCPVGEDRKIFSRENIQIYEEKANDKRDKKPKNEADEKLIQSWAHIRRYGTK